MVTYLVCGTSWTPDPSVPHCTTIASQVDRAQLNCFGKVGEEVSSYLTKKEWKRG